MSDYFSNVKQGLGDAVERRAHVRWYTRLLRTPYGRPLVVLFAALVIATPAVGAVTNWFSFGRPNSTPRISAANIFGVVKPGSSKLLSLRVSDPKGGPAWGLRLVRTSRGNTCVQLGRVEGDQLGSLGIDDAWNNDHQFHAITPNASYADSCGSTDARGYGYINEGDFGVSASANTPLEVASGPQGKGCKSRGFLGDRSLRQPYCPKGSNRVIFYGLLGPDALRVTYREPDGETASERTAGDDGAYLLVFRYDGRSCTSYSRSPTTHRVAGWCGGDSIYGASPNDSGVITRITYRDGHSCDVDPPARLATAYASFNRMVTALRRLPTQRQRYRRYDRLWNAFLRRQHLTAKQFGAEIYPRCPAVGWVPFKRRVMAADVTAAIHLRTFAAGTYPCPKNPLDLPRGCNYPEISHGVELPLRRVIPVEWSFRAREPVTRSNSWYAWDLQYPRGCGAGGEGSATDSSIRVGQILRYSTFVDSGCRGTYRLVVGYMPAAPQGVIKAGGGVLLTGRDGSLIVGRASFTIR